MVLFFPLIHAIRRAYPYARIVGMFTGSNGSDYILEKVGYSFGVELIFTRIGKDRVYSLTGLCKLFFSRWDLIICRFNSYSFELLVSMYLTNAYIIGHVKQPILSNYFNRRLDLPIFFTGLEPEIDRYFNIAKEIGIEQYWNSESFADNLIPILEKFPAKALFSGDLDYVVLVPGSSTTQSWKRWASSNWRKLIILLLQSNVRVVILGGSEDVSFVNQCISSLENPNLVDLVGRLTLIESITVMYGAKSVVTNDSGLMHLAVNSGVNTIAMFGPTNEGLCGHLNKTNFHALRSADCPGTCYSISNSFNCERVKTCMEYIKPSFVYDLILKKV